MLGEQNIQDAKTRLTEAYHSARDGVALVSGSPWVREELEKLVGKIADVESDALELLLRIRRTGA
jgi:hypothetical protein